VALIGEAAGNGNIGERGTVAASQETLGAGNATLLEPLIGGHARRAPEAMSELAGPQSAQRGEFGQPYAADETGLDDIFRQPFRQELRPPLTGRRVARSP